MITRKLGKLLRGNATPFQLMAASILGTLIGFAPGIGQAPALYVILVTVLLIVDANLGLALLCAALGRVFALVSAPVCYSVGTFLPDGPTSGIARGIVNAPVLAWCGLEYYAVAGGQLLGLGHLSVAVGTTKKSQAAVTSMGFRMNVPHRSMDLVPST